MNRLPIVSGREVVQALEKVGYLQDRQRGSHIVLRQTRLPPPAYRHPRSSRGRTRYSPGHPVRPVCPFANSRNCSDEAGLVERGLGEGSIMKHEFTAVFERDGEWYVAYCPEISGANGQGRTKEEARESLLEAITLILEDRGLTFPPASLDER